MRSLPIFLLHLACLLEVGVYGAGYSTCRMVPEDALIYHRRIRQDPTRRFRLEVVSFPEMGIDAVRRPGGSVGEPKVISCILCKDLRANAEDPSSSDSQCKIISGGVGFTFVKLGIGCLRQTGYDYDIKIFG